ncbi:MAG: hypothetical protein Q8M74_05510 [Chloroflexota bacterium]|nr:hypothetical protein [Chloroflexota bacterium]
MGGIALPGSIGWGVGGTLLVSLIGAGVVRKGDTRVGYGKIFLIGFGPGLAGVAIGVGLLGSADCDPDWAVAPVVLGPAFALLSLVIWDNLHDGPVPYAVGVVPLEGGAYGNVTVRF